MNKANGIAARLGPGISVTRVDADTQEQAKDEKLLGSPTIRVNGRDIEGPTWEEGPLCCRTYEDGAGVPPEWMVEAAVLSELKPRGCSFSASPTRPGAKRRETPLPGNVTYV